MGTNDIKANVPEEINFQHYKNEILNLYHTCPICRIAFDKRKNKLCMCGDDNFHCNDCLFYDKDRYLGCRDKAFLWGLSKYEEPQPAYEITAFEHEFLKKFDEKGYEQFKTLVDFSGKNVLLVEEKSKDSNGYNTENFDNEVLKLFSNFEKYRNYNIKEVLNNCKIVEERNEQIQNGICNQDK